LKTLESITKSLTLFILIALAVSTANSEELKVTGIESAPDSRESRISISDGNVITVSLVRIKPIAFLKASSGEPRLLLSGADCTECDMNDSIYLIALKNQSGELPRSVYPGNLKAYDTGRLVEKHRMFYGHCLSAEESVVWLSSFMGEDQKWHVQNSVIHVGEGNDEPVLLNVRNAAGIISKRVLKNECFELRGVAAFTEP
jgi:hypothetical protein